MTRHHARFARATIGLALGATWLAACADRPPSPTGVGPASAERRIAPEVGKTPEHVALAELTRAVAIALGDQGLRSRVRVDMRDAPFEEHKLELRSYLAGKSGGILLAKMAKETGRSREELSALLQQVRPLEFYMPVQEHRERWRGEAPVLVAALLEDEELPIAYRTDGSTVSVSAADAPDTPTLVLVPVETDFSRPLDAASATNVGDQNGMAIGSFLVTCEDGGCDGGGGTVTKPAGLYMTFSRLHDDGEPWTKGNPEIEVHVHGPSSTVSITEGADLSCSGEHAPNVFKRFDQNNAFWSGEVLLFTDAEIAAYNQRTAEGFNVLVWEDDDTACTLKNDKDNIKGAIETTRDAYQASSVRTEQTGWLGLAIRIGRFVASLYKNASWLLSNDDWLGDAVAQSAVGYTYTDANHVTMKGTSLNGRMKLIIKQ